ncbi:MAG: aminotransferase class III-fold pyridoxal phosphate-dependent enzyme [Candidatus Micrarchaeota archaeon]
MTRYACQKPGPKSVAIIKRDSRVIAHAMTREYDFVFKRAKGMYIWDVDGREYLDFMSSVAVLNIGHDNPDVAKAVKEQLKYGMHCGFSDFYAEIPVRFSETLVSMMPKGLNRVFLSNSGTESVEAAYKLARYSSSKKWTIAFTKAFHGRTMGSLSMTNSKPVQRERYGPFLPVQHVPYPYAYRMGMEAEECSDYCLGKMEDAMRKVNGNLASVFVESVQGEGGYIVPPKKFLPGVRKLCDRHGALMCDDEVQAGCFRTGKFLGIENFGVKPDIVCLSKAIGGGIPLGATIANSRLMDNWPPGSHANTFGGNLLACAGGIAALNFMKRKKLGQNATRMGKIIMKRLKELEADYEEIGDVRGLGLMIGMEIVRTKKGKAPDAKLRKALLCEAAGRGLLLLPAGESVIRIAPPLIINKEQAGKGLDILEDSIKAVCMRS